MTLDHNVTTTTGTLGLTSSGGGITSNQTLEAGSNAVTVTATGNVAVNSANGGSVSLTSSGGNVTGSTGTTNLAVSASGDFNVTNTGDALAVLTAGGLGTLNNTGTLGSSGAWNAGSFAVTSTGAMTLNHNVTTTTGDLGLTSTGGGITSNQTLAAGANDVTVTATGNVAVNSANGGSVSLTSSGGNVTGSTGTTNLAVSASGDFNVTNTGDALAVLTAGGLGTLNNTGTLGSSGAWNAGSFAVTSTGAMTLNHNVTTTTGDLGLTSTAGGITSNQTLAAGANDVTVTAPGIVNVNLATGSSVSLTSSGASVGGSTATGSLAVSAATTFNVTNTGDALASLTAGGLGTLNNTGTLGSSAAWNAGSFAVTSTGAMTLNHTVTTTLGDMNLFSGGPIALNASLFGGSNVIRLSSAGAITQTAPLFAERLGVRAVGPVDLSNPGNDVRWFAGEVTGSGAGFSFADALTLRLGEVDAATGFARLDGLLTNGGDVLLRGREEGPSTVAEIVLIGGDADDLLSTGYNGTTILTGDVRIVSAGPVSQRAPISARRLGVRAFGPVYLESESNAVSEVAAWVEQSPYSFNFTNSSNFVVGNLEGLGTFISTAGVFVGPNSTVPSSGGRVDLRSVAGDVVIGRNSTDVLSAENGRVRIVAGGGVTQIAPIVTDTLGVRSVGAVVLTNALNDVRVVSANVSGIGERFSLTSNSASGLDVREVASSNWTFFADTVGVTTAGGDILLRNVAAVGPGAAASVWVERPVNAGTGVVRLQATGQVGQTSTGPIYGAALGVRAGDSVQLTSAMNDVGVVSGVGSGANDRFAYNDGQIGRVGDVGSDADGLFAATTGLTTNNGDVLLRTETGGWSINSVLNAGTGTVRIVSAGPVLQAAPITAAALGVRAGDYVQLTNASNDVGIVSGVGAGANDRFAYVDAQAANVGDVGADTDALYVATTGLTTNNGDVLLRTEAGGWSINSPLNAGTAGTVRIVSAGAVLQTAPITGAALGVRAGDYVQLTNASNDVGIVSGVGAGANDRFAYRDALIGRVGDVGADADGLFAATTGLTTNNGDVLLRTETGGWSINSVLNAGTGTVRIVSAGTVSQASSAPITARALGVRSAGDALMTAAPVPVSVGSPNRVTQVSGEVTGAGSDFVFISEGFDTDVNNTAPSLRIVPIAADLDGLYTATAGVKTNGGDVLVEGYHVIGLSVDGPVDTGTAGTVYLVSGAGFAGNVPPLSGTPISEPDIVQTSPVTTPALSVSGFRGVRLRNANNNVGTIAGEIASSMYSTLGFSYTDADDFSVGEVPEWTFAGLFAPPAISGVWGGNVRLESLGGSIRLDRSVRTWRFQPSSSGNVGTIYLTAAGSITQDISSGAINNPEFLAIRAAGPVTLESPLNNASVMAAAVSGTGAFSYTDANAFEIGTVSSPAAVSDLIDAPVTGLTTTGGAITLDSVGSGTIGIRSNHAVRSSGGNVTFMDAATLGSGAGVNSASGFSGAGGAVDFGNTASLGSNASILSGGGNVTFNGAATIGSQVIVSSRFGVEGIDSRSNDTTGTIKFLDQVRGSAAGEGDLTVLVPFGNTNVADRVPLIFFANGVGSEVPLRTLLLNTGNAGTNTAPVPAMTGPNQSRAAVRRTERATVLVGYTHLATNGAPVPTSDSGEVSLRTSELILQGRGESVVASRPLAIESKEIWVEDVAAKGDLTFRLIDFVRGSDEVADRMTVGLRPEIKRSIPFGTSFVADGGGQVLVEVGSGPTPASFSVELTPSMAFSSWPDGAPLPQPSVFAGTASGLIKFVGFTANPLGADSAYERFENVSSTDRSAGLFSTTLGGNPTQGVSEALAGAAPREQASRRRQRGSPVDAATADRLREAGLSVKPQPSDEERAALAKAVFAFANDVPERSPWLTTYDEATFAVSPTRLSQVNGEELLSDRASALGYPTTIGDEGYDAQVETRQKELSEAFLAAVDDPSPDKPDWKTSAPEFGQWLSRQPNHKPLLDTLTACRSFFRKCSSLGISDAELTSVRRTTVYAFKRSSKVELKEADILNVIDALPVEDLASAR
jgi:hypothetical protein